MSLTSTLPIKLHELNGFSIVDCESLVPGDTILVYRDRQAIADPSTKTHRLAEQTNLAIGIVISFVKTNIERRVPFGTTSQVEITIITADRQIFSEHVDAGIEEKAWIIQDA